MKRVLTCLLVVVYMLSWTLAQRLPSSLKVEDVVCSLQDAEGFWWYGGKGTGLCRFDSYETVPFLSDRQHPDLLRSNDVLCMTEQRDSAEIWFGTKEGAYILSKKDYTITPLLLLRGGENELADKRITCMLSAADGSVWLTYRNQLLHFSSGAELIERFETTWEGKNRSVLRLCFDADSTLWAGLWNGGVIRWQMADGRWQMEKREWSEYPEEQHHKMTAEKTHKMLDSIMNKFAPANDTTVLSWAERPDGSIFVGTYHALYCYDGRELMPLVTGLDKVRSMAYSEKTRSLYLLSKARGICRWNGKKLTVLLDSIQFRKLHLQGDTALLLSEGVDDVRLLNLHTLKLSADTTTADVRPIVTSYIFDGEKHLMRYGQPSILHLQASVSLVEISLSTLDFDHASLVQFAYRLNGDDAWTELPEGEHMVKFARLPSGESRLQVRATDAYGRWGVPVTVLTLMRPAHWYEQWWLWTILVVGLIVFIRLKWQMSSIRPMNSRKTKEEEPSRQPLPSLLGEGLGERLLPVADQEFLDKAVAAVAANITNTEYSVDALAGDLCMSRANLHRRMRAVAGQTPTDFIRNQRLERAAHLLRTTSHSVNEIADLVGFSYASYFTKCFKEKYGVMPKDYRNL